MGADRPRAKYRWCRTGSTGRYCRSGSCHSVTLLVLGTQVVKSKSTPSKAAAASKQAISLIDSKRAYNMCILMNGKREHKCG